MRQTEHAKYMNPIEILKNEPGRIVLVTAPLTPPRILIIDVQLRTSLLVEDENEHVELVAGLRAAGAEVWEWERYRNFLSTSPSQSSNIS